MPNKRKHLTYEERFSIEKMLKAGLSRDIIAKSLERSLQTINQEIKRNGANSSYFAIHAHNISINKQKTKKEKYNKVFSNVSIRKFVDNQLKKGLSPERISFLSKKKIYVSAKSIRKYINKI